MLRPLLFQANPGLPAGAGDSAYFAPNQTGLDQAISPSFWMTRT